MDLNQMFNYEHILQQAQKNHHFEQVYQVQDSAKKLKDFLESTDKIDQSYQYMASIEFCAIVYEHIKKHGMM